MAPAEQQQQQQGPTQRSVGCKRGAGAWEEEEGDGGGHEAAGPVEALGVSDVRSTGAGPSKRACLELSPDPRHGYDLYWDGPGWWRQHGSDFGRLSDGPKELYQLWGVAQLKLCRAQAEIAQLQASSSSRRQAAAAAGEGDGPAAAAEGQRQPQGQEEEEEVRRLRASLARGRGVLLVAERRVKGLSEVAGLTRSGLTTSLVHTITDVTLRLESVLKEKEAGEKALAALRAEAEAAKAEGGRQLAEALERADAAEERVARLEAREAELARELDEAKAKVASLGVALRAEQQQRQQEVDSVRQDLQARVAQLQANEAQLTSQLTTAEARGRSLKTQRDDARCQLHIAHLTDLDFRQRIVPGLEADLAREQDLNDQLRAELQAYRDAAEAAAGAQQQQEEEAAAEQQQQEAAAEQQQEEPAAEQQQQQLVVVAAPQEEEEGEPEQQQDPEAAAEDLQAPIQAGRRTGGYSKAALVVGLVTVLLFVIAMAGSSSSSSSGPAALVPLLVSGATAVQQGVSAMTRAVGQRVGTAVSAEQAVSYWKATAQREAAGRRDAMAQLSATEATLRRVEADKAQAHHALSQLRQRQHEVERALEGEQADKAQLVGQTSLLQLELNQARLGHIDQASAPAYLWRGYELQRNLTAGYKARMEEEADQRRALQVTVASLSREVVALHAQLNSCFDDKAASLDALSVCEEGRRQAEAAAEQLVQDRRGACVSWASELAHQAKDKALSVLPPRMRPVAVNLFKAWAAMELASL